MLPVRPQRSERANATLLPSMGYAEMYVKAFTFIFGVYGIQMLLIPGNMVTDHWDMPSTPGMEFWIRGSAISIFAVCMLMMYTPTSVAAKVGLFVSVCIIGVCYPWNAKFGYFTPNLPLKYPMHYVPELLMLALSGMGMAAMMAPSKGKDA